MQAVEIDVGQTDVDRHALNVKAFLGDFFAVLVKHGVGLGRPIPRDHLERTLGFGDGLQRVEQVEQVRIDLMDITGAVIPQMVVHLIQHLGNVVALSPIDRLNRFPGVQIVERHRAHTVVRQGVGQSQRRSSEAGAQGAETQLQERSSLEQS